MSLGAVITTTNPLNTSGEITNSKPLLAFTIPQLLIKLADSNLLIVLIGGPEQSASSSTKLKIVTSIEEMMRREPSPSQVKERVNQDDMATLLYFSSTTGASKGAVSSHKNLIAMVQTVVNRSKLDDGGQTFICTVLMFHIYGLVAFATGLIAFDW